LYVRWICVVATAERKLAKRAGEAVGAATGGDCDRATCRRWKNAVKQIDVCSQVVIVTYIQSLGFPTVMAFVPYFVVTIPKNRKTIPVSCARIHKILVLGGRLPTNDVSLVVPQSPGLRLSVRLESRSLIRSSHPYGLPLSSRETKCVPLVVSDGIACPSHAHYS